MAPDLSEFLTPIKIEGADAAGFLHGQFTTDVTGLASGQAGLSAWCDPKGRVIATFILARLNGTFWLLLPEILKDTFLKRLKMYVLRANVVIVDAAPEDIPQLPDLPVTDGDLSETALIRQGIPLLHPETGGRFLPQELNLDKLGAVSYTKGCYPGQEIIARLRYRGEVKRRLCHATTDNNTLLQPGSALVPEGEERNIGTVVNSAITDKGQELLIVLERGYIETGGVVAKDFPASPVKSIKETTGYG
jgi:folate-binding protein YgfZ